jgi:hypothetical protein
MHAPKATVIPETIIRTRLVLKLNIGSTYWTLILRDSLRFEYDLKVVRHEE